jgi:predicted DNA-binding transcriptional regulator AlpA
MSLQEARRGGHRQSKLDHEAERRRKLKLHGNDARARLHNRGPPPLKPEQALDPNQVLRFREWIKLAGVSPATGWKILHSGKGPKWIRIGEKRVGIVVRDHVKWIERLAQGPRG